METLALPPLANIIHNISSSDENGFVPQKYEYQEYFLVTEVCGDQLWCRRASEGQFLFGFQYFTYPLKSTMKKKNHKQKHKLKSYTSKCGYTNQFPQFFPVTKIWDAALVDWEISDWVFSLAVAICIAK